MLSLYVYIYIYNFLSLVLIYHLSVAINSIKSFIEFIMKCNIGIFSRNVIIQIYKSRSKNSINLLLSKGSIATYLCSPIVKHHGISLRDTILSSKENFTACKDM